MSVLFAAVRGMTSLSESFMPSDLAEFMNAFLTPLTEVIERHGGTIDNYLADSIMAYWGGPASNNDHARNAVDAALDMMSTLDDLGPTFESRSWPRVRIEIGINSGPMIYGRFASRGSATVMGDAVNLGSRIEGLTRGYGVYVAVGEATARAIDGNAFRVLDTIRVKGKSDPLTINEPLGQTATLAPEVAFELELLTDSLEAYRHCDWDGVFSFTSK